MARSGSNSDNPSTWMALAIRSLRIGVIAFLVLQGKEYVDAGRFDTLYTAIDGALIGAGTFVVHALLWRPRAATS